MEDLENRVQSIEQKLDTILSKLSIFEDVVDGNFEHVKSKIDTLEAKVDNLDTSTTKNFTEVKWELKKIHEVTKYGDEYLNLPPSISGGKA
jgi:tetrahydromethanopterin S-methyltransferase subunit G